MNKDFKEVIGEVQNVRKDFKAIAINNIWYSGFKVLDFEKGDKVRIKYFVNNKGFNNIEDIFLIEENKQFKSEIISNLNKDTKSNEMSNQTFNSILINAREIFVSLRTISIEEATDLAYKSYKRLIDK